MLSATWRRWPSGWLRKRKSLSPTLSQGEGVLTPQEQLEAKDTQRMLDETLSLLKPRERQLFDMRALMALSVDEITQQTGIPKPSVTAMVSAARKKLFTELKRRMKQ